MVVGIQHISYSSNSSVLHHPASSQLRPGDLSLGFYVNHIFLSKHTGRGTEISEDVFQIAVRFFLLFMSFCVGIF